MKTKIKTIKQITKKLQKKIKATNKLLQEIMKAISKWKKAVFVIIAVIMLTACGTTKAVVSQPKDGSYTQITITTNNPITTTTTPSIELINEK